MSYVTTIVIFTDYATAETQNALASGIELPDGRRLQFNNLTDGEAGDLWPGPKWPEADVFGATGNYLDPEWMLDWLRSLYWASPAVIVWEANGDYDEPMIVRLPGVVA